MLSHCAPIIIFHFWKKHDSGASIVDWSYYFHWNFIFLITENQSMTISYKIFKVLWILQKSMHVWYNKLRYLISNFKNIWIRTNGIIMITENMYDNNWRYISYLRREPKSKIFTRNINICVPDKFFFTRFENENVT